MGLHYVLIDLLAILNLVRADGTIVDTTSFGYEVLEQGARWLAVRIALAEDAPQGIQRRGAIAIWYVVRVWC